MRVGWRIHFGASQQNMLLRLTTVCCIFLFSYKHSIHCAMPYISNNPQKDGEKLQFSWWNSIGLLAEGQVSVARWGVEPHLPCFPAETQAWPGGLGFVAEPIFVVRQLGTSWNVRGWRWYASMMGLFPARIVSFIRRNSDLSRNQWGSITRQDDVTEHNGVLLTASQACVLCCSSRTLCRIWKGRIGEPEIRWL